MSFIGFLLLPLIPLKKEIIEMKKERKEERAKLKQEKLDKMRMMEEEEAGLMMDQ